MPAEQMSPESMGSAGGGGGGAPFDATYKIKTATASLPNAQALSSLTGIAKLTAGDFSVSTKFTESGNNALVDAAATGLVSLGATNATEVDIGNSSADSIFAGRSRVPYASGGDATLGKSNTIYNVDATAGNKTVTLPTAVGISGAKYTVFKLDSSANTVALAFTGGQTLNGINSWILRSQYQALTIYSDGANWCVEAASSQFLALTGDVATWSQTSPRYYAIDPAAGNDANLGWSDTSMTLAGGAPIKTYEHLRQIVPHHGAGRTAIIAIKTGGVSTSVFKIDGVTLDSVDNREWSGYSELVVEGTTDFSDNTADRQTAGAAIALAGPNGDSSWTITSGATNANGSFVITVAAGTLTADPALAGKRVRFASTSTIPNAVGQISSNTSTVITGTSVLFTSVAGTAAAPVAGDTFFIEEPGVVFNNARIDISSGAGLSDGNNIEGGVTLKGIKLTGSASRIMGFGCRVNTAFLDFTGALNPTLRDLSSFQILPASIRINNVVHVTGAGIRAAGMSITTIYAVVIQGLVVNTNRPVWFNIYRLASGPGCRFAKGITLQNCGVSPIVNGSSLQGDYFGDPTPSDVFKRTVIDGQTADAGLGAGGIAVSGCKLGISNVDITGMGAAPCITIAGQGQCNITVNGVAGSTGNTDVGIDVSATWQGQFLFGVTTANTVTGTAGDIRVAGPAITTHAGLTTTNVSDKQGNKVLGSAGQVVGDAKLISNQSGGALAIGQIVRQNGTTGQATSAQADTAAHATGVYGPLVTPPASASNGYMVTTGTPWVQFDGTPTAGAIAYLSTGTAGDATTTAPVATATNQVLRLGYVIDVSGTMATVAWQPELIPITAT